MKSDYIAPKTLVICAETLTRLLVGSSEDGGGNEEY